MIGKNRAFTLIELLLAIAIIGIMIGMLLPALVRSRGSIQLETCQNNLRSLGQATLMYRFQYDAFPIGPSYYFLSSPDYRIYNAIHLFGDFPVDSQDLPIKSNTWICPSDSDQTWKILNSSYMFAVTDYKSYWQDIKHIKVETVYDYNPRLPIFREINFNFHGKDYKFDQVWQDGSVHLDRVAFPIMNGN